METWNTAWVPSYRLIAGPVRVPQISRNAFAVSTFGVVMTRYFFDIRYGDKVAIDEEGLELPDIEAAQIEAAYSLAGMVRSPAALFPDGHTGPGW